MNTFPSIRIEGGIFSPDLLDQLLAAELPGQKASDFGLPSSRRLTDEIAALFADASQLWEVFQHRLERLPDTDVGTSVTRDSWMLPFLALLGYELRYNPRAYEVDGLTFAVSHRAGEDEEAPPIHIVGYRQELGRLAPTGRPRLAPHSLVQEYLNRTDHVWGIVTNGKTLRLLRDSTNVRKQAYVEFDLQAMIEERRFQDFAALYRLLHRTRLPRGMADAPDCLLEKYFQHSLEQGGRVRDRLRDGVEECIKILANGFLRHPENTELRNRAASSEQPAASSEQPAVSGEQLPITAGHSPFAQELYHQLLRLVYRFLFLLVSEERGLISDNPIYREHYGITRLRKLVEKRAAYTDHEDLWLGLRLLWRIFSKEELARMLNVAPLNGELFKEIPLDNCLITNRELLTAFWHLTWYREKPGDPPRRVNYAALDVEELGSVYESLLDFHPQVIANGEWRVASGWRFELVYGSERKTTGSYYTPPSLVNELVKSALEPVMQERLAEAKTPEEKERAILSLKVLDPACGSGHFLLAAARRLGKELARIRTGEEEPAPERVREAVREVITHCIYGVDKNPLAVELCKVALWIEGHTPGRPLTFLDHRIRCGDSLVGVSDLSVLKEGIPDEAFQPVSGDDKKIAQALKKRNKQERTGQLTLKFDAQIDLSPLATHYAPLTDLPENTPEQVRRKKELFKKQHADPHYVRLKQACDLWTAAFFQPLTTDHSPAITSEALSDHLAGRPIDKRLNGKAEALSEQHHFFHWPLEFPEVFFGAEKLLDKTQQDISASLFDIILGNPPYGAIFSEREKKILHYKYPIFVKAKNSAAYFIAIASSLVYNKGYVGFVVPKSLTFSAAWSSTRELIYPQISKVIDVGQAWPNVLLEQILLVFSPDASNRPTIKLGRIYKQGISFLHETNKTIMKRLGIVPTGMSLEDYQLFKVILKNAKTTCGEFCTTQRGAGLQKYLRPQGDIPVVLGRDISEFIKPVCSHFINMQDLQNKKLTFTTKGQAIFQNIVAHLTKPKDHIRLIGTVVNEELACADTVNLLNIQDNSISPLSLAGYLMTDLINWFVYVCIYNRAVRTMHFDGYVLAKIPVPSLECLKDVEKIAQLLHQFPRNERYWKDLNQVVYDLFKVPTVLREYVETMHKPRWKS